MLRIEKNRRTLFGICAIATVIGLLMAIVIFPVATADAQQPSNKIVYVPATDTFYMLVLTPRLNWPEAVQAGSQYRHQNRQGRIWCCTSLEEWNAVVTAFGQHPLHQTWTGGYRTAPSTSVPWQWISGERWWSSWAPGEPNNTRKRSKAVYLYKYGQNTPLGMADVDDDSRDTRGFVVEFPRRR